MIIDTDLIKAALVRELERGKQGSLPDSLREVGRRLALRSADVRAALQDHEAGRAPMRSVVEAILRAQGGVAEVLSEEAVRMVLLSEGLRVAEFFRRLASGGGS